VHSFSMRAALDAEIRMLRKFRTPHSELDKEDSAENYIYSGAKRNAAFHLEKPRRNCRREEPVTRYPYRSR
jgi:uncharacterized protein (DUF3084 family)